MSRDHKLNSLIKKFESQERELIKERDKIDKILSQRKRIFEATKKEYELLLGKIENIESNDRVRVLQEGEAIRLGILNSYVSLLKNKSVNLIKTFNRVKRDYDVAKSRFLFVDKELSNVRIEIKKIENLVSIHKRAKLVIDEAVEEILNDELSLYGSVSKK